MQYLVKGTINSEDGDEKAEIEFDLLCQSLDQVLIIVNKFKWTSLVLVIIPK